MLKSASGRRRNGLWPSGDRLVADHHMTAVIGGHWARGKGRTNNRIRVTRCAGDQNRDEDADASAGEGLRFHEMLHCSNRANRA
jgi:hypothetical protein